MAMLNVGQFEHALNELLAWLDRTDQSLDDATSVTGDHKHLEIELAKLKVTVFFGGCIRIIYTCMSYQ